jgi:hypothetical protein
VALILADQRAPPLRIRSTTRKVGITVTIVSRQLATQQSSLPRLSVQVDTVGLAAARHRNCPDNRLDNHNRAAAGGTRSG